MKLKEAADKWMKESDKSSKKAQNQNQNQNFCELCNKEVETFYDPKTGKRMCQKCYMKNQPNMEDLMNKNTY